MPTYTLANAKDLIGHLNAHGAGIPDTLQMEQAVLAWMRQENGGQNNPLNIMGGYGTTGGQHPIAYSSLSAGYEATAKLLTTSSHYTGIIAAGRTGNPTNFLNAVAASPWDAAHYGTKHPPYTNHLINVFNDITSGKAPPPTNYSVTGGTVPAPTGGGIDLNPLDAVGSAIGTGLSQIGDTFTWLGFILVGLVLVIGGIFLLKPSGTSDAVKTMAVAA